MIRAYAATGKRLDEKITKCIISSPYLGVKTIENSLKQEDHALTENELKGSSQQAFFIQMTYK
jgi:hypothetical protein